jgi:hypothetical protein
MKNSSDTIGNRTCDLPVCSAVPQSTAPPRAPETNSKVRNIRNLNRDITYVKKGYQPGTNIVKDEKGFWLQTLTVFWLG